MSYQSALIYTQDGVFVGYSILGPNKLQTTNLYKEHETDALEKRIGELNGSNDLKNFWPHPQDPEVLAIVNDQTFMPLQYIEAEVVDDDHSYYVYKKVPEVDSVGRRTGNWVDSEEIDEDASVVKHKIARIPKNPSDVMLRIKSASEIVARRRASATM
jgi:hypothetical protein